MAAKNGNGSVKRETVTKEIPLKDIKMIAGFNARKDYHGEDSGGVKDNRQTIEQMADSIRVDGQQQPGRVWLKDGKYFLIFGFRRYQALVKLSEKGVEVPGFAIPNAMRVEIWEGTETEAKLANLVENTARNDLRPWELADRIVDLRDNHNLTSDAIAVRISKSKGYVDNLVRVREKVVPSILTAWRNKDGRCSSDNMVRFAAMSAEQQLADFDKMAASVDSEGGEGGEPRGPTKPGKASTKQIKEAIKRVYASKKSKEWKMGAIECLHFALGLPKRIKDVYDPATPKAEEVEEELSAFNPDDYS